MSVKDWEEKVLAAPGAPARLRLDAQIPFATARGGGQQRQAQPHPASRAGGDKGVEHRLAQFPAHPAPIVLDFYPHRVLDPILDNVEFDSRGAGLDGVFQDVQNMQRQFQHPFANPRP